MRRLIMSSINDSHSNINAEEIKKLYRIEEVIGDRVSLKKSGKNLIGLCPFHKESSPSLTVYLESQSFYCFGCETGGDLINFLMEFDKKSFREVVMDLANQKGINQFQQKSINFPSRKSKKNPQTRQATPTVSPTNSPTGSESPTFENSEVKTINLLLNDNFENFPKIEPICDEAWTMLCKDPKVPRDRKKVSQIIYQYSSLQQIWRFEWSTSNKSKPEKTFKYRHLSFETKNPKWIWSKGDDADFIWAYGLEEILEKLEQNPTTEDLYLLHLEGEKSVEIARSSGISAFSIRGTREDKIKALSFLPKSVSIIHLADNDEAGRKHAIELGELCSELGLKFTAIDTSQICPELTNVPKADIEEILNLICPGQFVAKISEILSSEPPILSSESQFLSSEPQVLSAESAILSIGYAGGGGGNPPIQQNADEARDPDEIFRLEILAYSDEVNLFRKMRLKGEITSRYRISTKELQELVDFSKGRSSGIKAQRHTGAEFLRLETEGIKWLIPGIIPGRGVTILGGAPGAGKTTIAYDMAASILYQEPFLGEDISQPGKVLFVSSDEQPCFAQDKLINRGYTFDEQWQFVTDWDISQKEELELYISDFLPQFVMIDSFAAIHRDVNFDENSSSAKAAVYWLESMANKYGCAIVLIHHCNKNKEKKGVSKLRGNTAIAGACSAVLLLEGDNNVKHFSAAKLRGSEPFKWDIKLDADTGRWSVVQGKQDDTESKSFGERILHLFNSQYPTARLEVSEIENAIGGEKQTIYKALDRLCKRGLLVKRPSEVNRRFKVYGLPLNMCEITSDRTLDTQIEPSPPTTPVRNQCLTSETFTQNTLQTLDTTLDTKIDSIAETFTESTIQTLDTTLDMTLDTKKTTNPEILTRQETQTLDTHTRQEGERGGNHSMSNIDSIPQIEISTNDENKTEVNEELFDEKELMSKENIECFAGMLRDCQDAQTLDDIRSLIPNREQRSRCMNEAVKLLPKVVQNRIKNWVIQLNHLENGQKSQLG